MLKVIAKSGRKYEIKDWKAYRIWSSVYGTTTIDSRLDVYSDHMDGTVLASFPLVNMEAMIVDEKKVDLIENDPIY